MIIKSFQINNFRSINDSGKVNLSFDRINTIIGKNESGKTSFIEAIHHFLNRIPIKSDEIKFGEEECKIICEIVANKKDYINIFLPLKKYINIASLEDEIKIIITGKFNYKKDKWSYDYSSSAGDIKNHLIINNTNVNDILYIRENTANLSIVKSGRWDSEIYSESLNNLLNIIPHSILFTEQEYLLPDTIDINDDCTNLKANQKGEKATNIFLEQCGINLTDFLSLDLSARKSYEKNKSAQINKRFHQYWHQTIGEVEKFNISFSIETHNQNIAKKNNHYIAFWINDVNGLHHLRHRSTGARWFISFFLCAISNSSLILIDEPGSHLHHNAQRDLLKFIEDQSRNLTFIYTTHSPNLIPHKNIHRIFIADRDEKSTTKITPLYKASNNTTDSTTAIFKSIGSEFYEDIFDKKLNIIIEELSGYYYLKSIFLINGIEDKYHLFPSSGSQNTVVYGKICHSWSKEFLILLDDDNAGKQAEKKLKEQLFKNNDKELNKRIKKINGFASIEELFSKEFFTSQVLDMKNQNIENSHFDLISSSTFKSKINAAINFYSKVKFDRIKEADLDERTRENFSKLIQIITDSEKDLSIS